MKARIKIAKLFHREKSKRDSFLSLYDPVLQRVFAICARIVDELTARALIEPAPGTPQQRPAQQCFENLIDC